jgi:hypothetical protein
MYCFEFFVFFVVREMDNDVSILRALRGEKKMVFVVKKGGIP